MKKRFLAIACAAITLTCAEGAASSQNGKWTGVWQGKLDGQPSVELTLADDTGDVGGTIVFHAIKKDAGGPHVISTEPHTLIHPHVDGNSLAFQVIRGNGSNQVLHMIVKMTADGRMEFSCSNCSATGTLAELQRAQ